MPILDTTLVQLSRGFLEEAAGLSDFVDTHHKRQHDAHVSMHRGAQQRTKLRLEQLRLIQTHPDRAPPEKRVCLRRKSAYGKLVATYIERTDHDRLIAESLDNPLVRAILLVLIRHSRSAYDEEFRAHEPDAFSTRPGGGLCFFRKVDIRSQRDPHSVKRDRLGEHKAFELDCVGCLACLAIRVS